MDGEFSKVLRAPSLKRTRPEDRVSISDRIKLEKVLGVTVRNNAALDSNSTFGGTVAYPAGCTVVLFNTKSEKQSHIINSSRKSVTSLAFSSCGRYLVTGECGHQPAVRVWDLHSDPQSNQPGLAPQPQQIAEFLSHKYGVNCVAFSPSNKYVVSVGTQHDMIVNVWDWKSNIKVASNKVSTKVKALAFADNGSYFVTVGNRHVKFWFLEYGKAKFNKEAVPLMGRSAILGEQRNNYFCDVACGKAQCGDSTYAITRSGLLCEFNNRRLLDKWVELRTTSANCIAVGENYIFVGCAEGIIRCFEPSTLQFITTLPRTHSLGVDVSQGTSIASMAAVPKDAKYPDTVAITYDEKNHKLTSIYNDHSIYVWDVYHIIRVGKSYSYLYHSACIWGVEMAPSNSPFPEGSFLTCSSDDTIRVWTLDKLNERNAKGMYRRNVYSNELLKVVYIDRELAYLKDLDISSANAGNDKQESSYDGRNGVRSIRISPDGKNLASGDRSGNIRIHETVSMNQLYKIEAHDAEVLCLEYTGTDCDYKLMASASRDRLIHVFDVVNDYDFLQTLDDHSSSITAVRFLVSQGNLQMVSCGADKSLIFRSLSETSSRIPQFTRSHNATGKTTLYDMEVDVGQKHVLTACQDRSVRIYSATSGKHTKSFKGSSGDDGTLIKVVLDRTGIYLATSCTDKSLSVYDYYSGECMATMCGHSELVTGLRFTNDCRRLISASGDGCIFVWRIPHDMVVTMHARLSQQALRQGKTLDQEILENTNVDYYDANQNNHDSNYRFSVGQLPLWAKKHINEDTSPPVSLTKGVCVPKGRWAQRAERTIGVNSIYHTDSVIPFPSLQVENRLDSDGSKDSSIDSGTETRQYSEMRTTIIKQDTDFIPCPESYNEIICNDTQQSMSNVTIRESRRGLLTDDSALGSLRDPDIESNAHDGDIDSDQEYRQQPLYYPTQIDSASGSEFIITNIDADELRKSQRRIRRSNVLLPTVQIDTNQESEDDDDEASTPSGENTDRNPMSFLSASSESLDQIVSREKYLQSTFESLSGADYDLTPNSKSTISSQFLTRGSGTSPRNVAAINAVKQTKNDPEAIKKREELNKRIAETKKKLQNVGRSPLKYSQSIHDLSHIPEKDKWNSPGRNKQGNTSDCGCYDSLENNCFRCPTNNPDRTHPEHCCTNTDDSVRPTFLPSSFSVPTDLQLCGCFMKELTELNDFLNSKCDIKTPVIKSRKQQLDKTLTKYKMHKSLPVSPVSEERSFVDFVRGEENASRKSFSYFIDLENETSQTDEGFKQVCSDIQKFSVDFNKKYEEIEESFGGNTNDCKEEDGNFSSDSLEDYSFRSVTNKNTNITLNTAPRRCVSNNELSMYTDIPKSESFYLNPNASQESVLSDEFGYKSRSYCNSLESVLSNESDCKSAPLEVLFTTQKASIVHSQSLPSDVIKSTKTIQTQTDFSIEAAPNECVIMSKKANASVEFKQKLLKFESEIARNEQRSPQKKPIAFFVDTDAPKILDVKASKIVHAKTSKVFDTKTSMIVDTKAPKKVTLENTMYIPSLDIKNRQYKSKFCNVLNNKPEFNTEIYESGAKGNINNANFSFNFAKNNSRKNGKVQETSSLDRHLFAKSLLESEKVCHKPPKAVRRHSSKTRRTKTTYEYVRKDDIIKNVNVLRKRDLLNNQIERVSKENTIELSYKEKNIEKELDMSNRKQSTDYLNELYDSLDKSTVSTRIEQDSLEFNLDSTHLNQSLYDSLEVDPKNICSSNKFMKPLYQPVFNVEVDSIQFALENIKILNEIQRKIHKINNLVDVFKSNMCSGKVRALSSMYESLTNSQSFYNDLTRLQTTPIRFRRRNLSLPNFVERRLNYESAQKEETKKKKKPEEIAQVPLAADRFANSSLRKSCSLSDLSVQLLPIVPKRKVDRGEKFAKPQSTRNGNSISKNHQMTRSNSTGVLNQSDSENEGGREKKLQSRLMRPTISSQNKVANNNKNLLQNRKRQSYSATNLNTLVTGDVSTSEDDDKAQESRQPVAAPRRHQSNKDKKMKTNRNLINFERKKSIEHNRDDRLDGMDVTTVQLSTQLCDEVGLQLTKAADNVVELYRRLTDTDANNSSEQTASVHKTDMVKNLEMSIIRTQKMLQDLTFEKLRANNGVVDVNQTDTVKKLNDLVSRGLVNDPNNVISLMQQYSDILLGMMQQKIQNSST